MWERNESNPARLSWRRSPTLDCRAADSPSLQNGKCHCTWANVEGQLLLMWPRLHLLNWRLLDVLSWSAETKSRTAAKILIFSLKNLHCSQQFVAVTEWPPTASQGLLFQKLQKCCVSIGYRIIEWARGGKKPATPSGWFNVVNSATWWIPLHSKIM